MDMSPRRPTTAESAALLARVLEQMSEAGRPLCLHEFDHGRLGCSANNLGTRMPEWARMGLVVGHWKDGMKAWEPGAGLPFEKKKSRLKAEVVAVTSEPLFGKQFVTVCIQSMEPISLHSELSVRLPRVA